MAKRKHFALTETEATKLRRVAAAAGMSVADYVRGMVDAFLQVGSDRPHNETVVEVPVIMEESTALAAEAKARSAYGCSLRDILRFEIAELDKL